jgi:peptidoglycan hydrolase-like protein with peptidoglycan-binding domain
VQELPARRRRVRERAGGDAVSIVRSSTSGAAGRLVRRWRLRRPGRRWLAGAAALVAAAGVAVAVVNPFAGGTGSAAGAPDSGSATSLATVERRSLTSQALVDGTLGYAGSSSIVVPAGTSQTDLRAAQQAVASAQATLRAAEATLAADERALGQARAKLAADRLKQASDCSGDGAAGGSSGEGSEGSGSSPCVTAGQTVASDEDAVSAAEQKVTTDRGSIATARATLVGAERSLAAAESSATGYETTSAFTMLPSPGNVIRRGQALYAVDGQPVLLLYGQVAAWRAFRAGMSPGQDVAALNANLRALGYGGGRGESFSAATGRAIKALQAARGLAPTGILALGSLVFRPGPVRVTGVTPTLGQAVQAGPVLSVSSTRHRVVIKLDVAYQTRVKVGLPATITLPSGETTAGLVSAVGSVASTPSDDAESTPTIDVTVRLLRQAAAGRLDQAPVSVAITTGSVENVLVVPVNALLALTGGGYAVEVVNVAGVHRLVPVTLGLFDDAQGLVEVRGSGLRAGQRIVVPAS